MEAKPILVVKASLTVSVYDDAGVGLRAMEEAEEAAAYVFHRAGLEVEWLNCTVLGAATHTQGCGLAVFPTNLQVRIVKGTREWNSEALGISYLGPDGSGCYSDVFLERVEELHRRNYTLSPAPLLGQAIAHELGHLLLGKNAHAPTGIMRARWLREDLERADRGGLLFYGAEAKAMRKRVAEGVRKRDEAAAAALSGSTAD